MVSCGSNAYTYNANNQLLTAGGHTYTYNGDGMCLTNVTAATDTKYVYDTNVKLSRMLQKTENGVVTDANNHIDVAFYMIMCLLGIFLLAIIRLKAQQLRLAPYPLASTEQSFGQQIFPPSFRLWEEA